MNTFCITGDGLKRLISNLKRECDEFIAPKREHLDDIVFGDTRNDTGEILNYEGNSIVSPRSFLLPQTEQLFEIRSARENDMVPIMDDKKRIFYGVRPCDMLALKLMRSFFLDGYADAPYERKMKRSVFLALACTARCSSESFCHEMGAGPIAPVGFDLQFVPVKNGFLVDVGSEKGGGIVKANRGLFAKASPRGQKERKEILKKFTGSARPIGHKRLFSTMRLGKVKESVWEDIGIRCVVCSGCITLCPTCSCFSIADRMNGDRGVRSRYCDGCPYAGFTRMAGGTMPFPLHKDHIRRFFEHKLNVDVERYGRPGCVGCGRCIATCPGNISIRKFMDDALGHSTTSLRGAKRRSNLDDGIASSG